MADPITDEMVETAHEAAMEAAALTPAGEFIDVGSVGAMIRAALSAVAPMIRAQAFREAAALVHEMVAGSNELRTLAAAAGDAEAVKFHSWTLAAENQVAASLTVLAQKETAR